MIPGRHSEPPSGRLTPPTAPLSPPPHPAIVPPHTNLFSPSLSLPPPSHHFTPSTITFLALSPKFLLRLTRYPFHRLSICHPSHSPNVSFPPHSSIHFHPLLPTITSSPESTLKFMHQLHRPFNTRSNSYQSSNSFLLVFLPTSMTSEAFICPCEFAR